MADLTNIINTNSVGNAIDSVYAASYKPRNRLGLSEIGNPCKRYLWFRYHGFPQPMPEPRILRLFQDGHRIEKHIIEYLKRYGYIITNQQKTVYFQDGNYTISGSLDGIISGLDESSKPHVLEIKSASDKSFKSFLKSGYEAWNEKYKAQIHAYMLGGRLNRALAVVYNKNDSDIYSERIRLDKSYIAALLKSVFQAVKAEKPPLRSCPKESWYLAKQCGYNSICFG